MALYGWDASHYDGNLTKTILAQAKAEGITFFTHKLGEAIGNVDPTAATALAAGRDVGIEFLGGYWFNHGNDKPVDEVDAFLAEANRGEPWWKDFPGWFWQADLERSAAGLPSPAWAAEFCDRMLQRTGRLVVAYASRGQYGNTLAGLKHPLWNAAYPSSRQAPFRDLYPGDGGSGWTRYSGQVPVFWQYTSSATIAGRTTCDANAFRGDLAGLRALITGSTNPGDQGVDMPLTADDGKLIWATPVPNNVTNTLVPASVFLTSINGQVNGMVAALAAMAKVEAAIQSTLAAAAATEKTDTATLAAQIKAVGDAESAMVAGLKAQLDAANAALAGLPAAIRAELPDPTGGLQGLTADDVEAAAVRALEHLGLTVTA